MAANATTPRDGQPRRGQGAGEQPSERARSARERGRAAGNAGIARITGPRLRVTQTKSTISHIARNRATARALGLRGIGSSVEVVDNEATRGMVRQIRFLVSVEELPAGGSQEKT